jgi:hypothetical protein
VARLRVDGDHAHDDLVADGDHVFDALNPQAGAELRDMDEAAMAREVNERAISCQAHTPAKRFGANPG